MNPVTNDVPAPVAAANQLTSAWRSLPSIPDPVGFGGMFAAVLGGALVAGGGSQFREKPLWQQGTKSFSDRIYVLSRPDDTWQESATCLPFGWGHFGIGFGKDVVYLAGGVMRDGFTAACCALRARGSSLTIEALPDLPEPRAYPAAAVVAGRLFVSGGQALPVSRELPRKTWSLALADPASGWREEPTFPGRPAFIAAAASDATGMYLFGGLTYGAAGGLVPLAEAHRFDVTRRRWERLPDLPEPRVGAASPCPWLNPDEIWIIGGYAEVFGGAPREHPGFCARTLRYVASLQTWHHGPDLPRGGVTDRDSLSDAGPVPMIAAPAVEWGDWVVVVNGETRASVRTPAVIGWKRFGPR